MNGRPEVSALSQGPIDGEDDRWLARVVRQIATTWWTYVSIIVATASGFLSFIASGWAGAVVFRVVAVLSVVLLLILIANEFLVRQRFLMRQRLARLSDERDRYRRILERLIDRQGLNYEERLHIHVYVGESDADDRVVEEHVTTPTPRLYYRSLRPIYPRGGKLSYEDMQFEVKIVNGNGNASVSLLSESPMRVFIMFDPTIEQPITWTLAYKAPTLWAPLRRDGVDGLSWDARTPNGRQVPTFTWFAMTFHFPAAVTQAQIDADRDDGVYRESTSVDGGLERTWVYDGKISELVRWDIATRPAPLKPKTN